MLIMLLLTQALLSVRVKEHVFLTRIDFLIHDVNHYLAKIFISRLDITFVGTWLLISRLKVL